MAVTYAWRLDANKYAYILSPSGEEGYIRTSPLSGEDLSKVAKMANDRFGKNGTLGLDGYRKAYQKMLNNMPTEWQAYDILSADVYYTVDAAFCADLRGVGIKGIRYLGACDATKWNPNNPMWDPNIEQYDCGNIQGKFSVYGIYMDDQYDENGNIGSNITPENIFAVYNGANAKNTDGSESTATLQAKLESEIKRSKDVDTDHDNSIQTLRGEVANLTKFDTVDFRQLVADVNSLLSRVAVLESEILKIKNGSTGTDSIQRYEEDSNLSLVGVKVDAYGDKVDDTLYYMKKALYVKGEGVSIDAELKVGDDIKLDTDGVIKANAFYEN